MRLDDNARGSHTPPRSHMHSCAQGGHIKSGLMVEPSGCTFREGVPASRGSQNSRSAASEVSTVSFPDTFPPLRLLRSSHRDACGLSGSPADGSLCFPEKFERPGLAFAQRASCSLPSHFYLQDLSGTGDLKNTLKLKSSCRYRLAN